MNTHASRIPRRQLSLSNEPVQRRSAAFSGPQAPAQLRLQDMADAYAQTLPVQRRENKTGLPDQLKSGIENLSGYSMDDVKVHYDSDKPRDLQAHAYAQGSDIHVAPGQEKHLPHEAWHVVQQKQGRVKATRQLKGKVVVNDSPALEKEADEMGAKATQSTTPSAPVQQKAIGTQVVQRAAYTTLNEFFAAECPQVLVKSFSPEVKAHFKEAESQLPYVDFQRVANIKPRVNPNIKGPHGEYVVEFDHLNGLNLDEDVYVGFILHELIHIAGRRKYRKNNTELSDDFEYMNLHLPERNLRDKTIVKDKMSAFVGMSKQQRDSITEQRKTIWANWKLLEDTLKSEVGDIVKAQYDHIQARINYGSGIPLTEYDTVLFDITYYMEAKGLEYTETYDTAVALLNEARLRRNLPAKTKKISQIKQRDVQKLDPVPKKSWLTKTLGKVRNTIDSIHGM